MEAELVLKNGKYLDVKTRKFIKGDIGVKSGKIIEVNNNLRGIKEVNINGKYIVPGFIDGHIHLESSIISPEDFAKIVSEHGTTTVITDPHEIANVCGINGIKYMLQKTKDLPISVYFMVPSCVPSTEFDESAAILNSEDTKRCFNLDNDRILGLAEMMNYPGVINNNKEVLNKIEIAKQLGKRVDGHAPGLTGKDLVKYIRAGIQSDHECSTFEEAKEKIDTAKKLGQEFYIMIREGTAAKNLEALAHLIKEKAYKEYVMFATDDKHPEELKKDGHIDYIIRKAIKLGVKPEDAYVTATYNAAKYFGLDKLGKIESEAQADLIILDDVETVKINSVYKNGEYITISKLNNWSKNKVNEEIDKIVKDTIHMREININDIECKEIAKQIIGLVPGEIITTNEGSSIGYDLKNDIIKVIVIESHKGTMHIGIAYLKGLGLKKGAIGTTVAHDSHYMILAGTNDEDIVKAANEISKTQGGKIYVENRKVKAKLALPIAGLMTEENPEKIISEIKELKKVVEVNKGIDPFMNLSFVSLAVIGDIRLLPGGAFDVTKWRFVSNEDLEENK